MFNCRGEASSPQSYPRRREYGPRASPCVDLVQAGKFVSGARLCVRESGAMCTVRRQILRCEPGAYITQPSGSVRAVSSNEDSYRDRRIVEGRTNVIEYSLVGLPRHPEHLAPESTANQLVGVDDARWTTCRIRGALLLRQTVTRGARSTQDSHLGLARLRDRRVDGRAYSS